MYSAMDITATVLVLKQQNKGPPNPTPCPSVLPAAAQPGPLGRSNRQLAQSSFELSDEIPGCRVMRAFRLQHSHCALVIILRHHLIRIMPHFFRLKQEAPTSSFIPEPAFYAPIATPSNIFPL